MVDNQTTPFPMEQLDPRARFIHDYENFPSKGIPSHFHDDQPAQAVEAFPHVRMGSVQVKPLGGI